MNKIYFITGNADKYKEAKAILDGVVDLEQLDIDLPEIQSLDPHEVIRNKLQKAKENLSGEFVIEDVSVYIKSLNGFPGPLIKWFWKTLGNDGIAELVGKYKNHNAVAKVIVGYSSDNQSVEFFEADMEGKVVVPKGKNGWGWDPIFEIDGLNKTLAELTDKEKNDVSMRKVAFTKLKDYLLRK